MPKRATRRVGTTQTFDGETLVAYSLALNSGIFPADVERATNLNFANVELSEISGIKWHDLDGDGVFDVGEPPLPGWSIYLDLNNNNNPDGGEPLHGDGCQRRVSLYGRGRRRLQGP